MKRLGFVVLLLLFVFSNSLLAQENYSHSNSEKMSFYVQLAHKDANYEQSLILIDEKDELDFWKDQKRYELDLLKNNKVAYQVYMIAKADAYHRHFKSCSITCNHTQHNLKMAKEYLSSNMGYATNEIGKNSGKKLE